MARSIVSVKGGLLNVNRCVSARGYHVWFDCSLRRKPIKCVEREKYLEEYANELGRVLDAIEHPGFYRVEELIQGANKYYLRLVPITKKTMLKYIAGFEDKCQGQMELESGLDLIQDLAVRASAQEILYSIYAETAANSCKE